MWEWNVLLPGQSGPWTSVSVVGARSLWELRLWGPSEAAQGEKWNGFQTIMEQFNPSLRNFVAMGKNYEKALAGVTYAAKGYFDALVKMGELASESQGSKELGDVLFQMAEVHRQIQNQLEEMLKSFHNELLTQLEQKVELDARYLSAALKKYQTEQRSKGDALDKCQAELKKLRKKSQGSKNPQKYSDKELQYIDAISNKQGELENYVSDGYKTALTEERRRFCFLVEKQCAVAKNSAAYHSKGKELLAQKLPLWQQACADPNKIPERAVQLMQQVPSNGSVLPSALSASKSSLVISDPIPGAKPLPVPPELAPFVGSQSKLSDSYSNTLPVRKSVAPKNSYAATENKTLPRSSSMAAGLERNGRMRVKAIFSHAAGDNSTLLSFKEGDLITLLVPEARDGWHYGESEKTKMRGWFPFSYTRVLDSDGSDRLHMSLQQGKSSSTGNLLDKEELALPPPDYNASSRAFPAQTAGTFKQRPYSVAVPAFSQGLDDYGARAVSSGTLVSTV
ncbi:brain-specific angiogenesis inhibitor 1-associated protein 2 isoform X6 [Mustela erminea]|uniref:brain-specific angiogenesis inhibitor 1-associated protein 2 isoform X6 n=1 Tax=Mustela erminea TaxID=36723 RepID=UPI00138695A6|nr:brain-specific angiogenesis inhibitor 1-associated protein 2 isoform X6 [Mustela erminea]